MLRSLAALLCGLLAAALLPVSLLSVWVHGVVSDTDRYVETVTPLADDEVVQEAAVKELEREALQLAAISAVRRSRSAPRSSSHLVVQQVVAGPTFRTAWEQANRAAHEQLVAVLEDRSDARLDERGPGQHRPRHRLQPPSRSKLAAQGLVDADRAADINASFAVMDADQLAKARRAYDALDTLGFWLPLVWAVLVLLTLLAAHRRLATTAKLAVASLVTLGLLALVLVFARDVLTEDLPPARRRHGGLGRGGREPVARGQGLRGRCWRSSPWWRRCWPACSDAQQRRPERIRTALRAYG